MEIRYHPLPQPMTYSGPADSVVPGSIIGSTWSASVSVQEVFWCGWVFTCSKGTLEPSSSAISSGTTVTVDGVNYTIFETGVPGVGYIIGLKDFNGTKYIPANRCDAELSGRRHQYKHPGSGVVGKGHLHKNRCRPEIRRVSNSDYQRRGANRL